ncbi:hypothetical protein [Marinoscillum sp. MHG1-6]|uniref:hypothetical protein n=1 Tax=Marinoscillum sp. MHG1-6 TaxID=2959627 RepID=UPI0021578FCF|nr:hypothetical protein [Marinoscillum sp. MHG1-6]
MDKLKHDWLTDGLIDYEYKKYLLLAYLKDIKLKFDDSHLYPFLSDLVFHYRNLERIRQSKQLLYEQFPKSISKADFEKLSFTYEELIKDDDIMKEIEEIIAFAIPKLSGAIKDGKELFEFVEENVELSPIGLSSLYEKEGYLFITHTYAPSVSIYRYQVSIFEGADEPYRGISTTFINNELKQFARTYEHLKIELARKFKDLPNPATFLLHSKIRLPEMSTLLPVAKRLLVMNIAA